MRRIPNPKGEGHLACWGLRVAAAAVRWYSPSFHGDMPLILTSSEKLSNDLNEHDGPRTDDALDGLIDDDRADDVGDDEYFEAEQDDAAEVVAQVTDGVVAARRDELAQDSDRTRRILRR